MYSRIVFASPKGGVGRTTLVAQLSAQLASAGKRCMAVDLDPQNALGLHLSGNASAWVAGGVTPTGALAGAGRCTLGVVHPELTASGLLDSLRSRRAQVAHLPFGAHEEPQRRAFEDRLRLQPEHLSERLFDLSPPRCDVLVIDTPPGANLWTEAALELADLVVVPLFADAASFSLVPSFESYLRGRLDDYRERAFYLVNQYDPTRQLACDVLDALQGSLPGRVLPVVHDDELVREQLALGAPLALDSGSQAARDLQTLGSFVLEWMERKQATREAQAS